MKHDQEIRYSRHISMPLIGEDGQRKLLESKVLVIGAGGLGSPALLYLAASGVGTLGVADSDKVELSNLQRQVLFEVGDIGVEKTQSAKDALHDLNPDINVICHQIRIDENNIEKIVADYDIVADCSDNIRTRLLINDICYKYKKTLVSAAISGFSGQIATFKAYEGGGNPCYRCLYPQVENTEDANCSVSGVLSPVAGVIGVWQAMEVLKEVLKIGESLSGYLLRFDALSSCAKKVKLFSNKNCKCCG